MTSDNATSHSDPSDSDKQDQMDVDDDPYQCPAMHPTLKPTSITEPLSDSLPLHVLCIPRPN